MFPGIHSITNIGTWDEWSTACYNSSATTSTTIKRQLEITVVPIIWLAKKAEDLGLTRTDELIER